MKLKLLFIVCWLFSSPLAWSQACNYSVAPNLNFGSIVGLPTPQIDVSANININCPLLSLRKICISMPIGSGGLSIADRRMLNGGSFVQYQLYQNSGRTQIWGDVAGGQHWESTVLVGLGGISVPVYGRVFSGQVGKSVGLHQSVLNNIEGREGLALITPCSAMTTIFNLPGSMTAQLNIQPSCTISSSPLSFGTAASIGVIDASTNLSVNCTLNGAYTVGLNGGSVTGNVNDREMQLGAGPNRIDYQLYRDPARTMVWGNTLGTTVAGTGSGAAQSLTVYGRVPAQGLKPLGTYQDTITATVTY